MYIVGADSAFDHDLEKALFNIKCNTLSLTTKGLRTSNYEGFRYPTLYVVFSTIYFLLSKRRFVHSIPVQQKDSLKLKLHKEKFHACNQITGNHLRGDDPQVRRVIRALIRSQNATSFITQLFVIERFKMA